MKKRNELKFSGNRQDFILQWTRKMLIFIEENPIQWDSHEDENVRNKKMITVQSFDFIEGLLDKYDKLLEKKQ